MEAYIKVKNNLFYKIKDKEIYAINTDSGSFRKSKTLPTAYTDDVSVIGKDEFNNALKQIGLDGKFN
jgi:hypothetical protein